MSDRTPRGATAAPRSPMAKGKRGQATIGAAGGAAGRAARPAHPDEAGAEVRGQDAFRGATPDLDPRHDPEPTPEPRATDPEGIAPPAIAHTTPTPYRSPQPDRSKAAPGLYFVATPIGAARDITLRALDLLASADLLAAEDTRTLRHLMEIHGVPLNGRPMLPCHDHNEAEVTPRILAALAEGKVVVYASEAGTPLVSDPGFQLARAAIAAGQTVLAAPGASAVLTALTVAGLPSDRFLFAGFPPSSGGARTAFLKEIASQKATVILYESPKRIHRLLDELGQVLEQDRTMAICRELTKRFEETLRGSLAELTAQLADRDLKGELVVLIDRAPDRVVGQGDLDMALREALRDHRVKEAAALVSEALGLPKRDVYQRALRLMEE